MTDNERERDQGFKVTDRRGFTSEGELRPEADPGEDRSSAFSDKTPIPGGETSPPMGPEGEFPQESREGAGHEHEAIQFSSFILSLASGVLVHLGEIPDPESGQADDNLEAAHQTIDLLGMLKEKTSGNLTPEENHLLESVLYELRMKYLSKSKAIEL